MVEITIWYESLFEVESSKLLRNSYDIYWYDHIQLSREWQHLRRDFDRSRSFQNGRIDMYNTDMRASYKEFSERVHTVVYSEFKKFQSTLWFSLQTAAYHGSSETILLRLIQSVLDRRGLKFSDPTAYQVVQSYSQPGRLDNVSDDVRGYCRTKTSFDRLFNRWHLTNVMWWMIVMVK